jgi:pyridoxine 5-phosphate synthase
MPKLGVNIDHLATLREARKISYPSPIKGAEIAQKAGADSIVAHLRQDRRHINDDDMCKLREVVSTRLNMEMSINKDIVDVALKLKPEQATLVPENRQEITTEGGLDVISGYKEIKKVVDDLKSDDIIVSLFIDPDLDQVKASADIGADAIELHTGDYSNAVNIDEKGNCLKKLEKAVNAGRKKGLTVHAGHGLNYENVVPIAQIIGIEELNIGHAIISEAVFLGLDRAVKLMKELISL